MRKKILTALKVLILLLLPGWMVREVRGAEWVLYAVSLDGSIEEYYDRGTVTSPVAGTVTVTTKTLKYACEEGREKRKNERSGEVREPGVLCAQTLSRHRIDCRNQVDTLMGSADYDRNGHLIQQSQEPYVIPRPPFRRPPQEIYPESASEALIKTICLPAP